LQFIDEPNEKMTTIEKCLTRRVAAGRWAAIVAWHWISCKLTHKELWLDNSFYM
jgi:hypothetical protein